MIIVGGTGFLGRHLCWYLNSIDRAATVVSRSPDQAFLTSHAPLMRAISLEVFWADFQNEVRAAQTLIHMASTSVPGTFVHQPWLELPLNVAPAFELFARAIAVNPGIRLVFLSSGGTVYGTPHSTPIDEHQKLQPISPYGCGKVVLEECIRFLGRSAGLSYAILRVSNPVGTFQMRTDQGVVNVALNAALSGNTLALYNEGSQVRDFVDADDVARAIVVCADIRGHDAATWNVGSGHGTRISDVVDLVEKVAGLPIKRKVLPGRTSDVEYSVLNCERIYRDTRWRAELSLEQSIRKLIVQRPLTVLAR